jgi:hypothetical protein
MVLRPCLGPEEYEEIRGMNSAVSVVGIWKSLLAMADEEIFREKRRTDPERKHLWTTLVSTQGGKVNTLPAIHPTCDPHKLTAYISGHDNFNYT